ncbi:RNA 2',3'-cyclic phosphodiesterase [Enterobacillus tribolii]|uniref:RNA 2',3'-cyclic phosphodiesterase n=1 Tax=Enterobacillus tribolii TaxID=1487935 RepID=A0A370QPW0_9GAMM|nr:RNA 2',3'-cyclic phosphodiesterase [Enterobacillus tribolii]MBW7981452.1 RNA 2',3'-cyclic phosphodiesterase [Enterobacillus tribolii]RDK90828.1 2'-5' RNA ligase [Enterobacillus tribolii]
MTISQRLFFALTPPENVQQEIIQWRARSFAPEAGRPIAAANLHLTLAFLGEVSDAKAAALQKLAGRITQPPFTLKLDDAGHWPRPGVVWLGCRRSPRGLLQLAGMLRAQAARSGCYQSPQPFHPHITLLRGADRPVMLPAATPGWEVSFDHFSLYASVHERGRTRYHPLAHWPMSAASAPE